METDIEIWEIDRASRAGTKLGLAERVETEEMLEAVLVENPGMLMRGLTLVGRQFPVETGYADLLGIDEDGRLVVFELKREKLTRDAVAQVLDYGTYLEALPDSELATLITERSGTGGITRISDFEEWYGSQGGESIKPVRMVLVGPLSANMGEALGVVVIIVGGGRWRGMTAGREEMIWRRGDRAAVAGEERSDNPPLPTPVRCARRPRTRRWWPSRDAASSRRKTSCGSSRRRIGARNLVRSGGSGPIRGDFAESDPRGSRLTAMGDLSRPVAPPA